MASPTNHGDSTAGLPAVSAKQAVSVPKEQKPTASETTVTQVGSTLTDLMTVVSNPAVSAAVATDYVTTVLSTASVVPLAPGVLSEAPDGRPENTVVPSSTVVTMTVVDTAHATVFATLTPTGTMGLSYTGPAASSGSAAPFGTGRESSAVPTAAQSSSTSTSTSVNSIASAVATSDNPTTAMSMSMPLNSSSAAAASNTPSMNMPMSYPMSMPMSMSMSIPMGVSSSAAAQSTAFANTSSSTNTSRFTIASVPPSSTNLSSNVMVISTVATSDTLAFSTVPAVISDSSIPVASTTETKISSSTSQFSVNTSSVAVPMAPSYTMASISVSTVTSSAAADLTSTAELSSTSSSSALILASYPTAPVPKAQPTSRTWRMSSLGGLTEPVATPLSEEQLGKRQVGATVYATIDGVLVSWINTYSGPTASLMEVSVTTISVATSDAVPSGAATTMDVTSSTASSIEASVTVISAMGNISSTAACNDSAVASTIGSVSSMSSSGGSQSFSISASETGTESEPNLTPSPASGSSIGAVISFTPAVATAAQPSVNSPPPYSSPPSWNSTGGPSTLMTISMGPQPTGTVAWPSITSSIPSGVPSSGANCTGRDSGSFAINWEDLPSFATSKNNTSVFPPIENPYHQLVWANGWSYAPRPAVPFLPQSPPHLGIFIVDADDQPHSDNFTGTPLPDQDFNGAFGANAYYTSTAYWVDLFSGYFGCQNSGPNDCEWSANGWTVDAATNEIGPDATMVFSTPPCPGLTGCSLAKITFTDDFRNLTRVQFVATLPTSTTRLTYYVDDLEMAWSNKSCAATKERQAQPDVIVR
ncbi:MAG: hypothetical protein LQ340_005145 [Diploschistes diacapsis]|nr:MAG: hypothetical protein LQ340_005145 [Diploschistes diacapsis]